MGSLVFCIHHKEGCAWTGQLGKLKVSELFIHHEEWGGVERGLKTIL